MLGRFCDGSPLTSGLIFPRGIFRVYGKNSAVGLSCLLRTTFVAVLISCTFERTPAYSNACSAIPTLYAPALATRVTIASMCEPRASSRATCDTTVSKTWRIAMRFGRRTLPTRTSSSVRLGRTSCRRLNVWHHGRLLRSISSNRLTPARGEPAESLRDAHDDPHHPDGR